MGGRQDGTLFTTYAATTRDCLDRLETMISMAGLDVQSRVVREQIASGIQIVVQQARAADGTRRIVEISEITGSEGARLLMQPLFRHRQGRFEDCGNMPQFYERIGLPPASFHALPRELA